MNNIVKNNRLDSLKNIFLNNQKIIGYFISLILVIVILFISIGQINKKNNLEAANLYYEFLQTQSQENLTTNESFNRLVSDYDSSGYAFLALFDVASNLASAGYFSESITYYEKLIETSNKDRDSALINKLARINISRLYINDKKFDMALEALAMFKSNPSDPYINELLGDIYYNLNNFSESMKFYSLAVDQYSDSNLKALIEIKIASLIKDNQ